MESSFEPQKQLKHIVKPFNRKVKSAQKFNLNKSVGMDSQNLSDFLSLLDYLEKKNQQSEASDLFFDFIQKDQNQYIFEGSLAPPPPIDYINLFKKCNSYITLYLQSNNNNSNPELLQLAFTFQEKVLFKMQQIPELNGAPDFLIKCQASYFNNLGVLAINTEDYGLALTCFESAVNTMERLPEEADLSLLCEVALNNLAILYLMIDELSLAEEVLLKSVGRSEKEIFKLIKQVAFKYLKTDHEFLNKLMILIYGYLYCDIAQYRKQLVKRLSISIDNNTIERSNSDYDVPNSIKIEQQDFLKNAYSLNRKFFGDDHYLTKKIIYYKNIKDNNSNAFNNNNFQDKKVFPFNFNQAKLSSWKLLMEARKQQQTYQQQFQQQDDIGGQQKEPENLYSSKSQGLFVNKISPYDVPRSTGLINNINHNNNNRYYTGITNSNITKNKVHSQYINSSISINTNPTTTNNKNFIIRKEKNPPRSQPSITQPPSQQLVTLPNHLEMQNDQYLDMMTVENTQPDFQNMKELKDCLQSIKDEMTSLKIINSKLEEQKRKSIDSKQSQFNSELSEKLQQLEHNISELKNQNEQLNIVKQKKEEEVIEVRKMLTQLIKNQENLEKKIETGGQTGVGSNQASNNMSHNSETSLNNRVPNAGHEPSAESIGELINQVLQAEQREKFSITISKKCFYSLGSAGAGTGVSSSMGTILGSGFQKSSSQPQQQQQQQEYIMRATFTRNSKLSPYVVTLRTLDITGKNQLAEETIEQDQLLKILEKIDYMDVLPTTMPIYDCESLYSICKYLIIPFTIYDQENAHIKLFPKSPGILSKVIKREILGSTCVIFVHHIEGSTFRIIIQREYTNQNLRIDLEFDRTSLPIYFEEMSKEQVEEKQIEDFLNVTQIKDVQKVEGQELCDRVINPQQCQKLYMQLKQNSKNEEYELVSYRIKSLQDFLKFLDSVIVFFEEFARIRNYSTMDGICEEPMLKFFKIKFSAKAKKATILHAVQQSEQTIGIYLKNDFQTFGQQGIKIKAQGEATLNSGDIQKMYGVEYETLREEHKAIFLALVADNYSLLVHEKLDEGLKQKSSKVFENPIVRNPFMTGGFLRKFISTNQFQYIMTFEEIGIANRLIGLKCTIFNYEKCIEEGMFFTVNEQSWFFQNEVLMKKLHHQFIDSLPLCSYLISLLLKEICIPILEKKIIISKMGQIPVIEGIEKIYCKQSKVCRLETVFSLKEVLKKNLSNQ